MTDGAPLRMHTKMDHVRRPSEIIEARRPTLGVRAGANGHGAGLDGHKKKEKETKRFLVAVSLLRFRCGFV